MVTGFFALKVVRQRFYVFLVFVCVVFIPKQSNAFHKTNEINLSTPSGL